VETSFSCDRYQADDYARYVHGVMETEEIVHFEKHAWKCPSCQKGLHYQKDQFENETLLRKTIDLLNTLNNQIDQPHVNIMDIVISKTKDMLTLIKTTGQLLKGPALVSARGEKKDNLPEFMMQIIKDFETPAVSVQASFSKGESEDFVKLKISLFDKHNEQFMPDVKIVLSGQGIEQEEVSDQNGEAFFIIKHSGLYGATLSSNSELIGRLNILFQ
jgi:hypothetical protein